MTPNDKNIPHPAKASQPLAPLASEDHFLALVDEAFANVHPHMAVGRGDDCALLNCPGQMAMTTDLFVEDVHFRSSYFTPREIGHKALAVNLSDLASAGTRPLGFSLGLMAPGTLDEARTREMLAGMAELAGRFDLALTGGDLSRGPKLGLCITVWGETALPNRFLSRRRCRAGDVLLAAGIPGLARAGLTALEAMGREAMKKFPLACAAHLVPDPLVDRGLTLAARPEIRGAMDVSDGLARDLPRFTGPDLGADLDSGFLAAQPPAARSEITALCSRFPKSCPGGPHEFAVLGGEDYCLLTACPPEDAPGLAADMPWLVRLGTVSTQPGLRLDGKPLSRSGFDHFNGNKSDSRSS